MNVSQTRAWAIHGSIWMGLMVGTHGVHAANAPAGAPVRVNAQTTLTSIRALPAGAQVELGNGAKVPAQRMVAVADAIRRAQSKPRSASTSNFSKTTASPALVLRGGTHLPSVMARPDTDVVQLPNGMKLTVGDMKKLAELSPALKGRAMLPQARGDLNGAAIRVTSSADLSKLRNAPDTTILENPNGVRVTLGELRAHARAQRR